MAQFCSVRPRRWKRTVVRIRRGLRPPKSNSFILRGGSHMPSIEVVMVEGAALLFRPRVPAPGHTHCSEWMSPLDHEEVTRSPSGVVAGGAGRETLMGVRMLPCPLGTPPSSCERDGVSQVQLFRLLVVFDICQKGNTLLLSEGGTGASKLWPEGRSFLYQTRIWEKRSICHEKLPKELCLMSSPRLPLSPGTRTSSCA